GLKQQDKKAGALWQVPYLPIDPRDIGRTYEAIIRINSQSGKGGVAHVMEPEFGFQLPKAMHREVGRIVNDAADARGAELSPQAIYELFEKEYLKRAAPLQLVDFSEQSGADGVQCRVTVMVHGKRREIQGAGNGPIDAFVHALRATEIG